MLKTIKFRCCQNLSRPYSKNFFSLNISKNFSSTSDSGKDKKTRETIPHIRDHLKPRHRADRFPHKTDHLPDSIKNLLAKKDENEILRQREGKILVNDGKTKEKERGNVKRYNLSKDMEVKDGDVKDERNKADAGKMSISERREFSQEEFDERDFIKLSDGSHEPRFKWVEESQADMEEEELSKLSYSPVISESVSDINKDNIVFRTIEFDRTVNVSAQGKVPSFRALVVSGNKNGSGGFGIGKGKTVREAIEKARAQSLKRWISLSLDPNLTIPHDVTSLYKSTRILIRRPKASIIKGPRVFFTDSDVSDFSMFDDDKKRLRLKPPVPPEGLRCGKKMAFMLEVFGIQHCTGKVISRDRSVYTLVGAVFQGLSMMKTRQQRGLEEGRKIQRVELQKLSRG